MGKVKKLDEPRQVMGVYDNGGYTMDRYTIWIMLSNGKSFLVTTNSVASIWDSGEDMSIDVDALESDYNYKKNTGEKIEWDSLSEELRTIVSNYFKDSFTYDYSEY